MAETLGNRNIVTKEELDTLLDRNNRKIEITDEALEIINTAITEPEFDGFRFVDTLVTYQSALSNTKAKLTDYINAVKFCSFLEVTEGNTVQAYIKTFKDRDFVKDRADLATVEKGYRELCSAATRYRKSPLVVNILTQAEIPLYILFQGYRYKAISVLDNEMNTAKLSKDRIAAADKLLLHTKPPENLSTQVDININDVNIVDKYEEAMRKMAQEQTKLIGSGGNIHNIVNVKIADAEIIEESVV